MENLFDAEEEFRNLCNSLDIVDEEDEEEETPFCESLFKHKIHFYHVDKTRDYIDYDLIRYTLKYETIEYLYIDESYSVCKKIIVPFAYYKASELIKDEGIGCRCVFHMNLTFDHRYVNRNIPHSDYRTRYYPIRKELELFYMDDESGDHSNLIDFFGDFDFDFGFYSRYCKLYLSIYCYCYLDVFRDLNEYEEDEESFLRTSNWVDRLNQPHEEPPKLLEESFRTDTCVICLDKEPNILFINCGHICICSECEKIKPSVKCPYCRTEISRRIKIKKKYFPLYLGKIF